MCLDLLFSLGELSLLSCVYEMTFFISENTLCHKAYSFWLLLGLLIVYLLFTFNLCLYIENVSFANNIAFSCSHFLTSSKNQSFLRSFSPFMSNEITDILGLISVILLFHFNFSKLFCILFSYLAFFCIILFPSLSPYYTFFY